MSDRRSFFHWFWRSWSWVIVDHIFGEWSQNDRRSQNLPKTANFPVSKSISIWKTFKKLFFGKNLQIKLSKKWSAKVIKVPIKVTLDKFKIRILLIWKIRLSKFIVIGEMIADHDRDRQSRDFQNMIVGDHRSWFGKMIVSDRRSWKKVSFLTLHEHGNCLFFM